MFEANVGESATTSDDAGTDRVSSAALEADLEPRVARLEHLVAGFGDVLERFRGASAGFGATVFDNFDDPGVSNDALDLLFASSTDARRDLAVLRRDGPTLVVASNAGAQHRLVRRLELLGASAAEVAMRFEQFERSLGPTVPPRTPGGVGRLNEFVGLIVRALLDIAEVRDGLRWDKGHAGLGASAGAEPGESPTRPPELHRSSAAAIGLPVAGAIWRALGRRRTRLMVEFGGVVVVGVAILFSTLNQGDPAPGLLAGAASPSAGLGRTAPPGVAVASPGASPSPGASTEGGASAPTPGPSTAAPVPTRPRSTPRPTQRPAPTLGPGAAAATRFNNRIATAASSIDDLLGTITTAVHEADLPRAATAANEIGLTATQERSWLLSHPAAACYQSFQESAVATYGELIATATTIAQTAEAGDANAIHPQVASSRGDVAALRQAGSKAVAACA